MLLCNRQCIVSFIQIKQQRIIWFILHYCEYFIILVFVISPNVSSRYLHISLYHVISGGKQINFVFIRKSNMCEMQYTVSVISRNSQKLCKLFLSEGFQNFSITPTLVERGATLPRPTVLPKQVYSTSAEIDTQMILPIITENYYVVQICISETFRTRENSVYKSLESCRSILQAKGHILPLKLTMRGYECRDWN